MCASECGKLSHVSLSKMIILHNCRCAVIDVQSLHKDLSCVGTRASSGTFVTNEGKKHQGTSSSIKIYYLHSFLVY